MKWTYLLLAYVSLIALGLADNIRGPVYPELLTQFQLSGTVGSFFFSLTGIFGMFNNLLTHHWLAKWGVMRSLRIYLTVLTSGCLVLAFANHIALVWLGVAMLGVSFGGLAVTQNLLVVHGSTPKRRTQALSGLHTMYALASILAPIAVSTGYLLNFHWNTTFLLAAVVALGALTWSLGEKTTPQLNLEEHTAGAQPTALGRAALIWVASFTTFYVMTEILVSSRTVLYVRTLHGYTPKQANDLLSGFFIAMLAGRLVLTLVRVRVKNSTLLRGSLALALVALLLAIFVDPIWFAITGLAMSVSFPCMIAYASETFGAHTARVMAWIFTGNYVGLIIMHFSVGVIADTLGLKQAMLLGPIFLGVALVLLSLPPKLPRSETVHFPR